jgi:catechol 2,3-dioxygenase-like lactoylglutathione lyase family enzyme
LHFDHIALACRDVEAVRAWYERVLGFQVAVHKPPTRAGGQSAYLIGLQGTPTKLELMEDNGLPPPGREMKTRGLSHLALAVPSFAEWEARLTLRGVTWLGTAVEATGGGRLRSFQDLEGNVLQIVERR